MHLLFPVDDYPVIPVPQPLIITKNLRDCWDGYKYIPCTEIFNAMLTTSNNSTAPPLTTKIHSVFNDVLPYLKSFSRFFQQYQSIIFIAFIILGTGLMILMLFVLIVVLIQTRRQKTNSLRSIRSDDHASLFECMKRQKEKSSHTNRDKNTNHLHGNTIKYHLNKNDVESMPFYGECTTLPPPTATTPTR